MQSKKPNERGLANQPCGEFADRLVDLSDGELPAAEAAIVREHVGECQACRLTLARLDRSLGVLRQALATSGAAADRLAESSSVRPASRTHTVGRGWAAAGLASAALVACAVVAALVLVALGLNRRPDRPGPGYVASPAIAPSSPGGQASAGPSWQPSEMPRPNRAEHETPERIARRLALIEQVARLEASLAMTPDDPWFAAQRTANERLLAGFRQAVEELDSPANPSKRKLPTRDDVL
jgi:hypothetical protein